MNEGTRRRRGYERDMKSVLMRRSMRSEEEKGEEVGNLKKDHREIGGKSHKTHPVDLGVFWCILVYFGFSRI
jgi:hypothetical protein